MPNPAKPAAKEIRSRRYLARDFDQLRSNGVDYSRAYYPNASQDLSENGQGGMLLDFAVGVGDNLSFYLDHQFSELDPELAIETTNIERMLRRAGVPITGASPAISDQTFYVKVPATAGLNGMVPDPAAIPTLRTGSIVGSNVGVRFTLVKDIEFAKRSQNGDLLAEVRIGDRNPSGTPLNFILARNGICVSGAEVTQTVPIGASFVPFRRIRLDYPNVSQIMKVYDSDGNVYHEVSALTNDVVYRNVVNRSSDASAVNDVVEVVPAPYRFTKTVDLATRSTTLTFGGGSSIDPNDDAIPDPLDFAVALPYSTTFSRTSINPNQLLSTRTLGTAATNTTLTIVYRYGGGSNHNAAPNAIRNIVTLLLDMPSASTAIQQATVRSSVETTNANRAIGGAPAPTVDDLKALIPAMSNAQERVVSKPDLLARVYALPSNFGKVFRAAVRSNPQNPLASQLFIVSRDSTGLTLCPDSLKKNLVTLIAPYRMISDAIDVLDAMIVNFKLDFEIVVDPVLTKSVVLQNVLSSLNTYFDVRNFQIDQPINISEVRSLICRTNGVQTVTNIMFSNVSGVVDGRSYSDATYDMTLATVKGFVFPPDGGIFEVKFSKFDIVGSVVLCKGSTWPRPTRT